MQPADASPASLSRIPVWHWGMLGALALYQMVMVGWVMRVYLHFSVVLIPWLIGQPGYRLYDNVLVQHAPGSFWLQTLLSFLIPDPLLRARVFMTLVMIAGIALVYSLARRWWTPQAGLVAALIAGLWGPAIMDHLMYYEVILGVLAIAAVSVWHEAKPNDQWWRPLVAGVFAGGTVLFKQQGLAVIAVFLIWRILARTDWRSWLRDSGLFLAGAGAVIGSTLAFFALQGRLTDMLYWVWTYNTRAEYVTSTAQGLDLREGVVLVAWLLLVPLFALFVIPHREQWQRQGILLLGLLPALMTPAYPRYGRFHLSGSVLVVALIGAGAAFYYWRTLARRGTLSSLILNGYAAMSLITLAVALGLPTYYRLKLGPLTAEYSELIPVADWLTREANVQPGDRTLILPSTDPTWNIYTIGNFQPPTLVIETYGWFYRVPGIADRLRRSLDSSPPMYVILVENQRQTIPADLLEFVTSHYAQIGQIAVSENDLGFVTFYKLEQ